MQRPTARSDALAAPPAAIAPAVQAPSLRRLLLFWLLVPFSLALPVAAAVQYVVTLRPANQAFDRALGDGALALANMANADRNGVASTVSAQADQALRTDQTEKIYYALIGPAGELRAGDAALAGQLALRPTIAHLPGTVPNLGFADAEIDGEAVRVAQFVFACGRGNCVAAIAETRHKREQLRAGIMVSSLAMMIALFILGGGAILWATRRGLSPLDLLRQQLGRRSLDDLRPLDAAHVPQEVHGLVDAINRLFERLREAAVAQQAFLADAAHQLRTPLTQLRTEAELALLEPHPPSLAPMLHRLAAGATRSARLAEQLLALARSDTAARAANAPVLFDLRSVAGDLAADWVPRAIERDIDLGFELSDAPVSGHPDLVRELMANLLHNAIAYAGRGSRVTVRTGTRARCAWLEVEDNGPGIAADERARAFDRFVRGRGRTDSGTGLGLAIVRDIAHGHGGSVELLDPPRDRSDAGAGPGTGRGLLVRVRFSPIGAACAADALAGNGDEATEDKIRPPRAAAGSTPSAVEGVATAHG